MQNRWERKRVLPWKHQINEWGRERCGESIPAASERHNSRLSLLGFNGVNLVSMHILSPEEKDKAAPNCSNTRTLKTNILDFYFLSLANSLSHSLTHQLTQSVSHSLTQSLPFSLNLVKLRLRARGRSGFDQMNGLPDCSSIVGTSGPACAAI